MNATNMLTLKDQANIAAYKDLNVAQQVPILGAIAKLLQMQSCGNPPDESTMKELLTDTGNFEIAVSCYTAELFGVPWR